MDCWVTGEIIDGGVCVRSGNVMFGGKGFGGVCVAGVDGYELPEAGGVGASDEGIGDPAGSYSCKGNNRHNDAVVIGRLWYNLRRWILGDLINDTAGLVYW